MKNWNKIGITLQVVFDSIYKCLEGYSWVFYDLLGHQYALRKLHHLGVHIRFIEHSKSHTTCDYAKNGTQKAWAALTYCRSGTPECCLLLVFEFLYFSQLINLFLV